MKGKLSWKSVWLATTAAFVIGVYLLVEDGFFGENSDTLTFYIGITAAALFVSIFVAVWAKDNFD